MKIKKINQSAGVIANVVNSLESDSEIDALSAAQGKKIWDNMNYNVKNTTWAKEYAVNYTHAYVPKIVFLAWEQSERIYVIYREKLLLIYDGIPEGSSSSMTATLDTETKTATFSMSNTGILYTTEFPLTPIESY